MKLTIKMTIASRSKWSGALLLAVVGAAGCIDQEPDVAGDAAEVTVAPSGVRCLVVTAKAPSLSEAIVRSATLVRGTTARFALGNLPSGPATLLASGYAGSCPAAPGATALWTATPQVITATPGTHPSVNVTFQPNAVAIAISYTGSANACPSGQFACRRANGSLDACSTHATNRGACGLSCTACGAAQTCVNGVCVTPATCPAGQFQCARADGTLDACSDHSASRGACGASCSVCAAAQSCVNGICTDPASTCPAGTWTCRRPDGSLDACSDHSSNRAACGASCTACGAAQTCVGGVCTDPPTTCPAGTWTCARPDGSLDACSDHAASRTACGASCAVCGAAQTCISGVCTTPSTCPAGTWQCARPDGSLDACSNHASNRTACGASCTVCGAAQTCINGVCTTPSTCPAGTWQCARPDGSLDACSNHTSSRTACGSSCAVCGAAQSCINGVCTTPASPCPSGTWACARPDGSLDACSNHSSNRSACGPSCSACGAAQSCIDGVCVTPSTCPAGTWQCTRADGTLDACSDHSSNRSACGASCSVCAAVQSCVGGVCTDPAPTCPPGTWSCQRADGSLDACSDHSSNRSACGASCSVCAAIQSCVGGVCTDPASTCPPGTWSCRRADGSFDACSDHSSSRSACGASCTVCSAVQSCVGGVCQ